MKISVSSYSFNQYLKAGKLTLVELPKLAHAIGFDAIEFIDIPGETQEEKLALAAQIKAEADALGMEINAYTIGACLYQETDEASDKEVARLVQQLDVAVALGAKVMRHDVVYALGKRVRLARSTVCFLQSQRTRRELPTRRLSAVSPPAPRTTAISRRTATELNVCSTQ